MTSFRSLLGIAIGALVGAFGVVGCARVADRAVMFEATQHRYTQLMRFTDYEKAGHYVAPDDRSAFRDNTAALGDLRFTDYEVREVESKGSTGFAEVAYIGYRASDPVVVTYIETQEWENSGGVWLVRPHIEEAAR